MPDSKPNILVIWGDDIGISNLSCYSRGMMGYFTSNIDRIADEGMLFTDSYGEQSCTAGRSSFITGQSVYRTGLSKVEREATADPAGLHDPPARPAGRRRSHPARPGAVQGRVRGRPALDGRRDGEALPR